jgi:hypothetical protein
MLRLKLGLASTLARWSRRIRFLTESICVGPRFFCGISRSSVYMSLSCGLACCRFHVSVYATSLGATFRRLFASAGRDEVRGGLCKVGSHRLKKLGISRGVDLIERVCRDSTEEVRRRRERKSASISGEIEWCYEDAGCR